VPEVAEAVPTGDVHPAGERVAEPLVSSVLGWLPEAVDGGSMALDHDALPNSSLPGE
jgi:hypothetical protein